MAFTCIHRVDRVRILAGSAKGVESPNRQAVEKMFYVRTVFTVNLQSRSVIWS